MLALNVWLATLMFRCLQGSTPNYLSADFTWVANVQSCWHRLQLMVSLFDHSDSSPSVIVHFQLQALTCRMVFLTNSLHCRHNFLSVVNLNLFVSLILSCFLLLGDLIAIAVSIININAWFLLLDPNRRIKGNKLLVNIYFTCISRQQFDNVAFGLV